MNNKIWDKWRDVHSENEQVKRLESAKSAKCTPIQIFKEDCYGYFQGSSGRHETFLDSCSCIDFNRRKRPCKHMYRLAIELNLIYSDVNSDIRQINIPKSDAIPFSDAIKIIELLDEDSQRILLGILNVDAYYRPCIKNHSLTRLISSGIVFEEPDNMAILSHYPRNEINSRISTLNVSFNKNMRHEKLIDWCIENISDEIPELFFEVTSVVIQNTYKPIENKIKRYLSRKYDTSQYFDDNGNFIELRKIETELPDDDITNLLIKYGHYNKK